MPTSFESQVNPYEAVKGGDGNLFFTGSLQQNHTIPVEVFSGTNSDFQAARTYLSYAEFDGNDASRNGMWAPANERDALTLGSGMHRGSHPRFTKFINDRVKEIGDRYLDELRPRIEEIGRKNPTWSPEQVKVQAFKDADIRLRMNSDIDKLIGTVPELLQRIGPDGKPLMVFNNSDPRAPGEANAIMDKLDAEYRFYKQDADGTWHYGEKYSQLTSFEIDPERKGLLNFNSDGTAKWTKEGLTEALARQSELKYFADPVTGKIIDTRAVNRRLNSPEFREKVAQIQSLLDDVVSPNERFVLPSEMVESEAKLERRYVEKFHNDSGKMAKFAEYAEAKAKSIIALAEEAGAIVPELIGAGLKKAAAYFKHPDGSIHKTRVGLTIAGSVLALADLWVEADKRGGFFTPKFGEYLIDTAKEAAQSLISPTGLLIIGAGFTPLGPALYLGLGVVAAYEGIRKVLDYMIEKYDSDPFALQGFVHTYVRPLRDWLVTFEKQIGHYIELATSWIKTEMQTVLEQVTGSAIEYLGGETASVVTDGNEILIGDDLSVIT